MSGDNLQGVKPDLKNCIGYWDGDESNVVRMACALVIHYDFSNDKKKNMQANLQIDSQNLTETLGSFTRFYHTSEPIATIFNMLANQRKFRTQFQLRDDEDPDLFMVFITTHGNRNGMLTTDHGETFLVSQLYRCLDKSAALVNALKLLFISACRGTINDVMVNSKYEPLYYDSDDMSKNIDLRKPTNLNAARVKIESISENFITFFDCVETTSSYSTSFKSSVAASFCKTFRTVDADVGLDEFLAKCMYHGLHASLFEPTSMTPELKVLKHRQLTISKKNFRRKKVRQRLTNSFKQFLFSRYKLPINYTYDWKSDDQVPLLSRSAYLYITPRRRGSGETRGLCEKLEDVFGFEINYFNKYYNLKQSITDWRVKLKGCLLVCVIAPIIVNENEELSVIMDEAAIKLKQIQYSAIGPSTDSWIGKPKIFVFLNDPEEESDKTTQRYVQVYKKNDFTRVSTIHAGLLTVVLPQKDSLALFIETLDEFTQPEKIDTATFQQFFFELVRRGKAEHQIPPMLISTLEKKLLMDFPIDSVIDSFTLIKGEKNHDVSLDWLVQKLRLQRPSQETGVDRPQYSVVLVSGEVGSGKSTLARVLAGRARREQKKVTFVDIWRQTESLSRFEWSKGYQAFVEAFSELKETPRESGKLVILDEFDSVKPDFEQNLLKCVRYVASHKVPLLIFTRPDGEDLLKKCLEGFCHLDLMRINKLSREKQLAILNLKMKREREDVKREDFVALLDNIRKDLHAGELTERVGTLVKVIDFFNSTRRNRDNVFKLCEHVFKSTIMSGLEKEGYHEDGLDFRREYDTLVQMHLDCALHFLNERVLLAGHQRVNNYGIFRIEGIKLITLSKILSTYLYSGADFLGGVRGNFHGPTENRQSKLESKVYFGGPLNNDINEIPRGPTWKIRHSPYVRENSKTRLAKNIGTLLQKEINLMLKHQEMAQEEDLK